MSASPAGNTPGQGGNGARKGPPRRLAPQKPTNPLVTKRTKKKNGGAPPAPPSSTPRPLPGTIGSFASQPAVTVKSEKNTRLLRAGELGLEDRPFGDTEPSLFTKPPKPGTFTDYNVYTTKKSLLEGLRLHVARLTSHKPVDIRDKSQFTPPLYLLRRDIRAMPPGAKADVMAKPEEDVKMEGTEEDAEREAMEQARAAARAEIAPSQGTTKPRTKQPVKKTQQVFLKDQTPEQRYKAQLKYEEALPWHLEDDDHKQTWMGTYEEMGSKTWAQFSFEERNNETVAVITPLEKWYKFTSKARVEADILRQPARSPEPTTTVKKEGGGGQPGWMQKFVKQEEDEQKAIQDEINNRGRLFIAKGKTEGIGTKADEELDFEEDWADDEAPPELEGEEDEVKDISKRIQKDQVKANVFGMVGNDEYDLEEEKEKREKELRDKVGKKMAKALVKREHNAIYESDNENEYAESSDSEDTEEELLREKEKKEAEAKAAAATSTAANPKQPGSGASSRNNTPGHRPSKHPEPLAKTAAAAAGSLKRPGSPNLSDASGNESSNAAAARKKQKKSKLGGSKLATASNPSSRSLSPSNVNVRGGGGSAAAVARASFAGSGSDTDTPAGAKGLKKGSRPAGAGRSPSPGDGATPGASRVGSRAGSPEVKAEAAGGPAQAKKYTYVPSNEELKKLIPPEGMLLAELSKYFDISLEERKALINRMKEVATYSKATKLLTPLVGSK